MNDTCIFCRIIRGEIPATRLAETDTAIAFRDIGAQAPVHVLVVPKQHVASLADTSDGEMLGNLLLLAARVARDEGISDTGFRVAINTGEHGGQSVHHLHVHVLGGRAMGWPPG